MAGSFSYWNKNWLKAFAGREPAEYTLLCLSLQKHSEVWATPGEKGPAYREARSWAWGWGPWNSFPAEVSIRPQTQSLSDPCIFMAMFLTARKTGHFGPHTEKYVLSRGRYYSIVQTKNHKQERVPHRDRCCWSCHQPPGGPSCTCKAAPVLSSPSASLSDHHFTPLKPVPLYWAPPPLYQYLLLDPHSYGRHFLGEIKQKGLGMPGSVAKWISSLFFSGSVCHTAPQKTVFTNLL